MGSTLEHFIFFIDLPLLFFVAGYFSKLGPDQPLKSFKRLLIPYFVFCTITKLFGLFVLGEVDFTLIYFQSSFALWFLVALFLMKMALPIVDRFRYPIITALICAIIIGFIDIHPNYLGITRAFAYMPVFLVGYYLKQSKDGTTTRYNKFLNFFNRYFKLLSILIVVASIPVILTFGGKFFLFKSIYAGNIPVEMIKRLIVILLEICWVLMLDKVMTNKDCLLTQFGRNSMAVYLLHCYVRLYFKPIFLDTFANQETLFFIFAVVLSFVVTYVFSRDIVTKYINKLTDGVYDLIVKPMQS